MYENVPINLRRIMSEKNIGIKTLAISTNIEYSKITNIRKEGGDKWVTQELVIKLANALEIEPDQLTGAPKQVEIDQLPRYLKNYIIRYKLTPAVFAHRLGFPKDLIEKLQSFPGNSIALEETRKLNEQQLYKLGHSMGIRIVPNHTLTGDHHIPLALGVIGSIQKASNSRPALDDNHSNTESEGESDINVNPPRKRQRPGSIMTTPRPAITATFSPRQQAPNNTTTLFYDEVPMLGTIPTQRQHFEPASQHQVPAPFPALLNHESVNQTSAHDSGIASLREQLMLVEQQVKQLSTQAAPASLSTTQELSSEQEVAKLRKKVEKLRQKLKRARTHKTHPTLPETSQITELRLENGMLKQQLGQLSHPIAYPPIPYPPFAQPPYPMPWSTYPSHSYLPPSPQPPMFLNQGGFPPAPMYSPPLQQNALNITDATRVHPTQSPTPNTPEAPRHLVSTQTPLFGQTGSPSLFSSPLPNMGTIPLPSAYQNIQTMAAQSPNHTHAQMPSTGTSSETASPHPRHKHHKHKSSTKSRHAPPSLLNSSISPAPRSGVSPLPGGHNPNLSEGSATSSPQNPSSSVFNRR